MAIGPHDVHAQCNEAVHAVARRHACPFTAIANAHFLLLLGGQGYDGATIAALWALGVVAEIVLFAVQGRLPVPLTPTLLLMIGVLVVTLAIEVPIDNQIKTWTTATLPADWQEIRARWSAFHTVRTFLSLGAVAAAVGGALAIRPVHRSDVIVAR